MKTSGFARGLRSQTHALVCAAVMASVGASVVGYAAPAAARDKGQRCDNCGTVVTTNRKDEHGSGTTGAVVGGVGGAVAGNVLGHNTTSTVLGGVGGAVAGDLIGKRIASKKIWSVQVRMDRGGTQDIDFTSDPRYQQGQRVRVVDGSLSRL